MERKIKASDLLIIKDKFGLSQHDLCFLYGRSLDFSTAEEKIKQFDAPIKSITFTVMIRAIEKANEAMPIDIMGIEEIVEVVKPYEPEIEEGNISMYFGLGYWPAKSWKRGDSHPTRRVIIAFTIVKRLIDAFGEEGWEIWKESLEEEARARGTTFAEVKKSGTWNKK